MARPRSLELLANVWKHPLEMDDFNSKAVKVTVNSVRYRFVYKGVEKQVSVANTLHRVSHKATRSLRALVRLNRPFFDENGNIMKGISSNH